MSAPQTLSPSAKTVVRRSLFWVVAGVIAILIALIGLLASSANTAREFLDPTNAAPEGAKALVEVLRAQGVDVALTSTLATTRAAMTRPTTGTTGTSTLVVFDRDYLLTPEQRAETFGLAKNLVIIDPGYDDLAVVAPNVANAGAVDGLLTADCPVTAVVAAQDVTGIGKGFRIVVPSSDTQGCLGSGNGVYSLVRVSRGDHTVSLVGTTAALSNEYIGSRGNAALGLTLLGTSGRLVWYVPSLADLASNTPPTLGELSPEWVTPVTALLALTALAAALWRGRRFGPLVIENLPVVVRSRETTEGRARLYEKGAARGHTLDALRMGTLTRLAASCGLPKTATVEEIIGSVAALTGQDPSALRNILIDSVPATDRELMTISDALHDCEERLRRNYEQER